MMKSQPVSLPFSCLWANRPTPSNTNKGKFIRVTDIGFGGTMFFSDGTYWIATGPITLCYGGPALTAPANTNENILATISIPGGLLGPKGSIVGDVLFSHTYSSNNKSMFVRLAGSLVTSGTQAANYTTNVRSTLYNNNSLSSQKSFPILTPYGSSAGSPLNTSNINTANNASLTLSASKVTAGETLSLEGYIITLNQGF